MKSDYSKPHDNWLEAFDRKYGSDLNAVTPAFRRRENILPEELPPNTKKRVHADTMYTNIVGRVCYYITKIVQHNENSWDKEKRKELKEVKSIILI